MANHAISTSNVCPLPEPKPGHRFVPALIGRSTDPGIIAHVECPSWCTVDHIAAHSVFLEDLNHEGEHRAMSFSPSSGDRVPVEVYLTQWPGSGEAQTQLAVDLDYEVETYDRTAALALADQLVAFAADVRRLAQTLPDHTVRNQADEALRRVQGGAA
jgi:hypothetical protein